MADPVSVGTRIGDYRVTGLIGKGGMGVVYLAEPSGGSDPVALKVLAPELTSNEQFRRRFLREAGYASSLDHPNVVPVHDAGESDGLLFIAMRYVRGMDLSSMLMLEGALDPVRALGMLHQVASALDAAHATGLLHRDVKPANVLVASGAAGDHCYLTDFGLSKNPTRDSGALTAIGDYVGTYLYTAPEQILSQELDRRADVYSLACLLYEALTGEPPFVAPSEAAVLQAHLELPPPRASEARPGLPVELDEVIAKAMAKDPSERFETCTGLMEAARAALGAPSGLALEVTAGRAAGSLIPLGEEFLIGRDAAGMGSLSGDPEISRRHARIWREREGTFAIEDLGSTNGTFVNGDRLAERLAIRVGDAIEVGGTTLVARADAAATASPPTDITAASRPARVSLALSIDRASGEATLRLDEDADPVTMVCEDGHWRIAV